MEVEELQDQAEEVARQGLLAWELQDSKRDPVVSEPIVRAVA